MHLPRTAISLRRGATLIEVLLAALLLAVALAAILGAYLWQQVLNEHSRNLSLAIQDANRVMERLRQRNTGCTDPTAQPPAGANWDVWLASADGGGKSLQPTLNTQELIVVTCQNRDGTQYCPAAQMGTEWHAAGPAGTQNPLRVTVAVCWRSRSRIIGECSWNGVALAADDTLPVALDTAGVIDSPAMLTTLVTCRS